MDKRKNDHFMTVHTSQTLEMHFERINLSTRSRAGFLKRKTTALVMMTQNFVRSRVSTGDAYDAYRNVNN